MPDRGETREDLLNMQLSKLLGTLGVSALAKKGYRTPSGTTGEFDIIVDMGSHMVAIEAEFTHRGDGGRGDAEKRLTDPATFFRGKPVLAAYAVGYPKELSSLDETESFDVLVETGELSVSQKFHSTEWTPTASYSVEDLAQELLDYWIQTDGGQDLDEITKEASDVIDLAAEILEAHGHETGEKGSDPAATKALVWLNALMFQQLLHDNLPREALPLPHTGKQIPEPDPNQDVVDLRDQWKEILEINWWPIFHAASESLNQTSPRGAQLAIEQLKRSASKIASKGVIRQHDIAGRIYHRLLETRKFLATNYTSIPAAIVLSGLALDPEHPLWSERDLSDRATLAGVKIVDPACGSGTLLMAALQNLINLTHDSSASDDPYDSGELIQIVLENGLYGFDVVPGAIHLAASTLQMSETSRLISALNLWRMEYGVFNGSEVRLGSLDMLKSSPSKGSATQQELFETSKTSGGAHITGTGEKAQHKVAFPADVDLIIANPPYTRAGGPGDEANEEWNPIFGSLLTAAHRTVMTDALRDTLQPTCGSLMAGLGSAFVALADENIKPGGRIAFVLPATAATGSTWQAVRSKLLERYEIDWIISSHDSEIRGKKGKRPGRVFTSFSESTMLSEIMLVATRKQFPSEKHPVKFVNLKYNPRNPVSAHMLTKMLLETADSSADLTSGSIFWGSTRHIPQGNLFGKKAWFHTAFLKSALCEAAQDLADGKIGKAEVSIATLEEHWHIGPYHNNIKGKKQGVFDIDDNPDALREGYPALHHHKSSEITQLAVGANAWLTPRKKKTEPEIDALISRASLLQFGLEIRTNTQSVSAAITDKAMLGVRSWVSLLPKSDRKGSIETLCLWLNSTLGMMLRLVFSNRPYPGRSGMTNTSVKTLPVIDISKLADSQLKRGSKLYSQICSEPLMPFHLILQDSTRKAIDAGIGDILGIDESAVTQISQMFVNEPVVNGGKPIT